MPGYRNLYYNLPVFLLALFVLTLSISYFSEIRGEMKVAMYVCMYVCMYYTCKFVPINELRLKLDRLKLSPLKRLKS